MVTKKYTSPITLTEDTWRYSTKEQKEELLSALDYDESWAETKTIQEMVNRGGGMVASSLKRLSVKQLERNGGEIKVTW